MSIKNAKVYADFEVVKQLKTFVNSTKRLKMTLASKNLVNHLFVSILN
jgi:hypothetical protein